MKSLIIGLSLSLGVISSLLFFSNFCTLNTHVVPASHTNPMHNPSVQPSSNTALDGVAVIELYTSEGCSSCPPADDVFSRLAQTPHVFALGFHVSYWNRLGWRDSFSQKAFDERQYDYAESFNKQGVYTPQLVVNGTAELVGSKSREVERAVKNALSTPASVGISLEKTLKDRLLTVQYNLTDVPKGATLNAAVVESNLTTQVLRGENSGHQLHHDNVVRELKSIEVGEKQGKIEFSAPTGWQLPNCSVVVFVQENGFKKVLGAAKINLN